MIRWASPRTPDHRLAAVALARSALAGDWNNPPLHLALARALAGAGKLEEAEAGLRDALALLPDHEALHEELAFVLARQGQVEAALACAHGREASWASPFAFKLLVREGRRAETEALEAGVEAVAPADSDLLESRAKRSRDDPERLLRLSEDVLGHDPGAAHALYYKALALAQLGRAEESAAVMGLDRFLSVASLPAPPGFGGEEAFRETLRGEILANPVLVRDPAGHATRSGLRTRTFPAAADCAAEALVGAIREAISAYAEALSGDHPFVRARPARAKMIQWALVFSGDGRQLAHHHPGSWLTGVYYVSARVGSTGPGAPAPGAIRIGILPDWAGVEPPWLVREIEPVPGTLLLFPSFVPHETVPPGEGAERISVAFDVAVA